MNETQTRVLIQRELDGNLSQDEEARLRRVLMVSDTANSFRKNLSQVAAVAQSLDLPENVRPINSSQLATEILESLSTTKRSFWEPFFTLFSKKERTETAFQIPPSRASSSLQNFSATQNSGSHPTIAQNEPTRNTGSYPQVDQYVTGTHKALDGGLAKKLNKNQQQLCQEEKSITLAEAIRAKIHESRQADLTPAVEATFEPAHEFLDQSQVLQKIQEIQEIQELPKLLKVQDEQRDVPVAQASEIKVDLAPSISLTITGPSNSTKPVASAPALVSYRDSVQNPQDVLDAPAQTSPEPVIVPVTRAKQQPVASTLPIDAIGERINVLFQDPKSIQPPTELHVRNKISPPPVRSTAGSMDASLDACLSSVGRLSDIRYATNNPGTITNVGSFLFNDQNRKTVANFISNSKVSSSARVFTFEAARELNEILKPIADCPKVLGYVVCGYDGMIIANTLSAEFDPETVAGCALVSYMNSHAIMKVLGFSKIKQSISLTTGGYLILADFGRGLLSVLVEELATNSLASLSEEIELIVS